MIRSPTRSTFFPYSTLFRTTPRTRRSATRTPPGRTGAPTRCCSAVPTDEGPTREDRAHAVHRLRRQRSEEHTSELQSRQYLVCRLLLEKISHMRCSFHRADV